MKQLLDGWFEVARAGSHKQFKHPVKPGRTTVPFPKKDIPIGTLKSIEKQAGIKLAYGRDHGVHRVPSQRQEVRLWSELPRFSRLHNGWLHA
jgi:predicted RNA binding protein YcfA (HicA-like mRNA interferase family)